MRTFLMLMVASSMLVSGCSGWSESRANPSNWFGGGRSAPAPVQTEANTNPLIPERTGIFRRDRRETYDGTLVTEVKEVAIERTPTGAIVRAVGQSALQGAYDVRLTSENDGEPVDGVLTFSLKAIQPADQGIGTTNARTVRVGRFVSNQVLAVTQTIRIVADLNAQSVRSP